MQSVTRLIQGLLFASVTGFAGAVSAEEASVVSASTAFVGSEVISLEELGELSGGDGVTAAIITDQSLLALNQGNRVTGHIVDSGDISLGANAFSGFEGIGNFVVNTGHNNNLQSSMNVSILLGGGS